MKGLGNFCQWLHRLFMPPQFPAGSPQAERVELQRVLGSIQAVNACLPQTTPDSGTAAATSGLLNSCSTIASAFSVFVLQTQVAICWLWSQIEAILTRLTADEAAIAALQTEVQSLVAGSVTMFKVSGVDLTTVGITDIFTVPAGKRFICQDGLMLITALDTPTGSMSVFLIDSTASQNISGAWSGALPVGGAAAAIRPNTGVFTYSAPAGDVVSVSVITPLPAVAGVADFYAVGLLVDE